MFLVSKANFTPLTSIGDTSLNKNWSNSDECIISSRLLKVKLINSKYISKCIYMHYYKYISHSHLSASYFAKSTCIKNMSPFTKYLKICRNHSFLLVTQRGNLTFTNILNNMIRLMLFWLTKYISLTIHFLVNFECVLNTM